MKHKNFNADRLIFPQKQLKRCISIYYNACTKKNFIKLVGLLIILSTFISCQKTQHHIALVHPIDYVNPNIGSVHGRWFFFTPASMPFGMAKLAPHTNAYGSAGGWLPCGYDDRQHSIEGFGHFHEFQIGGVVTMPTVGKIKTVPGTLDDPDGGYRSRFDKKDEIAQPGYYSVVLKDYNIKAELTATDRVGFHRYHFPPTDSANIIFDIGHRQGESGKIIDASVKLVNDREIEGSVTSYPVYIQFCQPGRHVKMYFVARMNQSPTHTGTFKDSLVNQGNTSVEGIGSGMYVTFNTHDNPDIELQVGLSYTSLANARKNLDAESSGLSFDEAKIKAQDAWNQQLGKIEIEGGMKEDRVKFYTGLYHALLGRGIASDYNGQYPANDGTIGQIPADKDGVPLYHHYNTDGIWGAFWNLTQLWSLVYPRYFSEFIQSNLDNYKDAEWLHDGIAAGAYANGVPSNFTGLIIDAAWQAGIRDFNIKTAYQAARKNELDYTNRPFGVGKYDLIDFINRGFIPLQEITISNGWVFNFGASHTMEYSFSSYAVAQLAKSLGNETDYNKLIPMASNYKNLFDPVTRFIRPKEKDGSFMKDFNPLIAWKGFQEGNSYQYTWYVPQDVAGLMQLIGKAHFNDRLDTMFMEAKKSQFGGGQEIDSFSGLEKLYNHGNQPSLHISWLYNYSGRPWLTQYWTREICNVFYGNTALHGYGFGQDEDQGQLGAWYVLAAMGIFDVQGGTAIQPTMQLGSPLFDKITIHLDPDYYSGSAFVIETLNQKPENYYIQSAKINGQILNTCWVPRSRITTGGKLTLTMGPQPNKNRAVDNPPPSMSDVAQ